MSHYLVRGGQALRGTVPISGAKNSVLPILAATLLNGGRNVLHNCPDLRDVRSAIAILEYLGCKVTREGDTVTVTGVDMTKATPKATLGCRESGSTLRFFIPLALLCGIAGVVLACLLGFAAAVTPAWKSASMDPQTAITQGEVN